MPTASRPGAVLFACTMNSVRSPMAEGLARLLFGPSLKVASAGVRALDMDGFALCVMAEAGMDMMRHVARTFDEVDLAQYELIVTLSPEAHHCMLELTRDLDIPVEYWATEDVTHIDAARDQKLEAYRSVRDALMQRIKDRFGWRPMGEA
ncbi:low molecular weight phosphatase family protein [Rhodoblastus sp. 17X3]|uniref:arsenate-mycothiol transferase ArsC n=1 Tax=Rhodoblastus sp. 17X3 TaxID=3047026 RepID=UPI0024B7532D|nr:low molecular weight phosphatase family protein [Rhodoblastus sp. 17X3]MDI9848532.1 low molecular weight phosphatase family protein [Rhodoblastus sp. 17X3]